MRLREELRDSFLNLDFNLDLSLKSLESGRLPGYTWTLCGNDLDVCVNPIQVTLNLVYLGHIRFSLKNIFSYLNLDRLQQVLIKPYLSLSRFGVINPKSY